MFGDIRSFGVHMRLAVVLALIASLLFALGSAPAEAARKKKPVSCQTKAKKIKSAKKRRAALKKCKKKKPAARKVPAPPARPVPPVLPAVTPPAPPAGAPRVEGGVDDVTVVAVLDRGINPYHWDFVSAKLPQHQDAIAGNDVPLDRPATEWLPGFGGFESLDAIRLPLDADYANAPFGDGAPLTQLSTSTADKRRAYWLPGTKVIGAMMFGDGVAKADLWQDVNAHGVGSTSSVVGNLHGTCPECLLFFIDHGTSSENAEAAIQWAQSQPWIDVISNSYGHGNPVPKIYAASDIDKQRDAVERGQQIVFSGGNGFDNFYTAPNPTTFSSQKGPDWILTVGATTPGEDNHYGDDSTGGAYSGAGKPVDVAGVGWSYPNAYEAEAVGHAGPEGFPGSSNAAPTVAGLYARSLYLARTALAGPSRIQAGGVIAAGAPVACGAQRPDCELGDGLLTEPELRTRLLHGAVHSEGGTAVATQGSGSDPTLPPAGETELMGEGHGTYFARQAGPDSNAWLAEVERIAGPLSGRAPALERPAGEREWFVVDSYCRQAMWGAWSRGYFVDGATELPGTDPAWPVRSAYEKTCPGGPTPLG
jgi:hypothetical protein